MKSGYSHITLICDRSGSMQSIRKDAEGAVNNFIDTQKAVPGEATLLLIDFDAPIGGPDTRHGDWYKIVFDGKLADCPHYNLVPRGNTALLDAVGRGITSTGERLKSLPEDARPEHVFFVVQTDGQENSSKDFKLDDINRMVKEQTDIYQWEFVFLGMGPDTFAQGAAMGFQNVTRSADSSQAYYAAYENTGGAVAAVRTTGNRQHMAMANATVDAKGGITPGIKPDDDKDKVDDKSAVQ